MAGRNDAKIFRKSGTWRNFHADSGVVTREGPTYIVVYIDTYTEAGNLMVDGIRRVDDLMMKQARERRQALQKKEK